MNARNASDVPTPHRSLGAGRAGIAAGFVVLVLTVGLLVTAVLRVPDATWSVVLAVLTAGVAITLVSSVRRMR